MRKSSIPVTPCRLFESGTRAWVGGEAIGEVVVTGGRSHPEEPPPPRSAMCSVSRRLHREQPYMGVERRGGGAPEMASKTSATTPSHIAPVVRPLQERGAVAIWPRERRREWDSREAWCSEAGRLPCRCRTTGSATRSRPVATFAKAYHIGMPVISNARGGPGRVQRDSIHFVLLKRCPDLLHALVVFVWSCFGDPPIRKGSGSPTSACRCRARRRDASAGRPPARPPSSWDRRAE